MSYTIKYCICLYYMHHICIKNRVGGLNSSITLALFIVGDSLCSIPMHLKTEWKEQKIEALDEKTERFEVRNVKSKFTSKLYKIVNLWMCTNGRISFPNENAKTLNVEGEKFFDKKMRKRNGFAIIRSRRGSGGCC